MTNNQLFAASGEDWAATLDWHGWLTIAVFLVTFTALVKEILPPDVILLGAAAVLTVSGVITPRELLSGFSRDIIFTLAMLFVVAKSMEVNGVLGYLSQHVLPKTKNPSLQLFGLMFPLSAASAFLNNTPIVLMMTPVIRKWSLDIGSSPSKYLIPVSYATILGGACTLIGTSSNLVVDGLLRNADPNAGFGFFEFSYIVIPCLVVGYIYMIFVGRRLLPERKDPTSAIAEQTTEFTSEFLVKEDCPVVGKTIQEASQKEFRRQYLIEIERHGVMIDSPSPHEVIQLGDRLVFVGDVKQIAELHAVEGLQSMADPHFKLDVTSSHFSELVISPSSGLIGKTLRRINFRVNYGASVLAVYRQGKRLTGRVGDIVLHAGDTLMLLSSDTWKGPEYGNDFYYIRLNEKVPVFIWWRALWVTTVLAGMVTAAMMGVPMMIASLCAAGLLLTSGAISVREARKSIRWSVLILIASSFALGTALHGTGVASAFGEFILAVAGQNPHLLIAVIFFVTMVTTELITNTAAALLIFPIAIEAVRLAGFGGPEALKAVGITVAVAASCSFMTPIGYQVNTIVYGPGGYRFTDYMKVGTPLSFLILVICSYLIPYIWPLGTF